jgi:hypothetical protein
VATTEETATPSFTAQEPDQLGMDIAKAVCQNLSTNFKNSLRDGRQGFGMLK